MLGTKYRLGERIGAGGMAEVFRAHTIGTQGFERLVAVKRVLPRWSADPHFANLFINEARIMASLHHPNVVGVSDFARDDEGRLFLVMELVDGVALGRLIRTVVPLPVAIYIVCEMLRGLGHLHEQMDAAGNPLQLVHRDVSRNNVLVSWDGAVKISDFGLTKAYAGNNAGDSDAYGTPGYFSPEQIQGGRIDGRSDLFAVGVILYELLTGASPFVGANRILLELAVLHQRIEPPSSLWNEIPADLDAITMQLLERDPSKRPANAQAVIDALERCDAASHVGRTQLIALLRERFPSQAEQASGPEGPEGLRITERVPVQQDGMPALWLVGPEEKARRAPQGQEPMRSARSTSQPKPGRKRRAWAGLALLVGAAASSMLLDGGSRTHVESAGPAEAIPARPTDNGHTVAATTEPEPPQNHAMPERIAAPPRSVSGPARAFVEHEELPQRLPQRSARRVPSGKDLKIFDYDWTE